MAVGRDVSLLMDAFDAFRKASITMEEYYRVIEKRVEELNLELAEKNNYLTTILEGLPVGVIVTNIDGRIESVNNTACTIMGETSRGLIGKRLEERIALEDGEFETTITGGDKRKKVVSISSTTLKNLQGLEVGRLIVLKDVSELKRLREASQRDKRLAAMGEMAASIAHQIRNPLGSIELFASLLNEGLSKDEERQRFSKEIIHAVKTLNNVLSNMLLFANNSKPIKGVVSIEELVEETVGICRFLILDKAVRIEVSHTTPDVSLLGDRELLKQAILNLIINGIEAVKVREEGVVSIVSRVDRDGIHIMVSDNGCGIPEMLLDKVFDPFFTTKPKGTGLGLTVANNIIKAHGGFIEVEAREGEGTTFDITLPYHGGLDYA